MNSAQLLMKLSLGKGEVESSILSGSTTKPRQIDISESRQRAHSAANGRTYTETGKSLGGVLVEKSHFVPRE